jgi:hypothetical protein
MTPPRDPVERLIYDALLASGIPFAMDGHRADGLCRGLDFVTHDGIFIECKQFHTDRVAAQMKRADNVICIQGMAAARFFAEAIARKA